MAKGARIKYVCNSCGATSGAWSGKCMSCGEWNSIEEQVDTSSGAVASQGKRLDAQSVKTLANKDTVPRIKSGIGEIDNVLGGGFVPGSIILIAGQPGIGKSTLLLQIANAVAHSSRVLYISGEESAHQVGMRAKRLGVDQSNLELATSNSAEDIAISIDGSNYGLVIVDSIQTTRAEGVSSSPGSVGQITNSTNILSAAAKRANTALVIVGHVTKEGSIAGPKVLEHVVDVVLQLEGDRYGGFKLLRGEKNRYGPTHETGIFEMIDDGLKPVENPSAALLSERMITDGSIVLATMEGTRPILVEVQALVNRTSYGYPKRAASGVDLNRLNLLIAMLERRTKLSLADQDVYLNVVGGIRITEPAADLAICMAIASASKGLSLKKNAVVFGEIGLSGEVRHVPFIDKRVAEAKKLGFDGAIGPKLKGRASTTGLTGVSDIRDALNRFLEK